MFFLPSFNYSIEVDGKVYKGVIKPTNELLPTGVPFRFQVTIVRQDGQYYLGLLNMEWENDKLQNATQEFSDAIREFIMLWYQ